MTVEIIDCLGSRKEVKIGELKDIWLAQIKILSGDEVLEVFYKNGESKAFDSCDGTRVTDFYDGGYIMYISEVMNRFENEKWVNRKDSYDESWMDGGSGGNES